MINLQALLILIFFFCTELLILFFLLISIICRRIYFFYSTFLSMYRRRKISQSILNYLEKKEPVAPKRIFAHRFELLPILEDFNHRVKGSDWEGIKNEIARRYLFDKARKWTQSLFWKRRNFAARVFALIPLKEDEQRILDLLDDPLFLVHSVAALAAVQLESEKGIDKILRNMGRERRYGRWFYRDILLQGSMQSMLRLNQIAMDCKEIQMHHAALEVFAGKTVTFPIPYLEKYLASEDLNLRLAALKVLVRNPQFASAEIFMKYLGDPDDAIRAEAAKGLEAFSLDQKTYEKLETALEDPSWNVRFQAASSLKKMGKKGLEFLKQQIPHTKAYAVAQYALEFG